MPRQALRRALLLVAAAAALKPLQRRAALSGLTSAALTQTLPARAATFTVMTSAALFSMGLYQPRLREGPNGILLRTLGAFAMMTLAMAFLFYFLPALHLWRGVFVYAGTMSLVACLTTRSLFTRTVELDAFKRRVLVLGSGELKGYGELSASSWAASRQRDVLYKKDGLELELP